MAVLQLARLIKAHPEGPPTVEPIEVDTDRVASWNYPATNNDYTEITMTDGQAFVVAATPGTIFSMLDREDKDAWNAKKGRPARLARHLVGRHDGRSGRGEPKSVRSEWPKPARLQQARATAPPARVVTRAGWPWYEQRRRRG